ncbi:MAG TPA: DUF393 domain-containing protein [Ignavibacteria bacterium]|nr:DUF393 domain-containing protein [Ignavibacteria bacterium]
MGARQIDLENKKIILFDGVCNLCNGSVNFLIKRDFKKVFNFSPLQSDYGKLITEKLNIPKQIDSIILVINDEYYLKSNAVIEIIKELKWYWRIFIVAKIFPQKTRDAIYDFIANNRYKWFGIRKECMIPTEDIKSRFIEDYH